MEKLIITGLLSLFVSQVSAAPKIIYGEDNRVDVYASTDSALVELSKSTLAMIPKKEVKKGFWTNELTLKVQTLADRGICSSEPFANQPTAANCSAFLVTDRHIVTAGHCVKSLSDCKNNYFVFDYKMKDETSINTKLDPKNIVECKSLVARSLNNSTKDDYALIEISRVVTDRRPLSFRKSGKIEVGQKLAVIGHPTGLPTKIADGAEVRSVEDKFFIANLDTFGGNSGSAVFNLDTHEVEGILVRGDKDYVKKGGCMVPNRVSQDGGRGEDVTHITNIQELLSL